MNFDKMTDDDILLEDDSDILLEDGNDILLEDYEKPYTISDTYTAADTELELEYEEDYSPKRVVSSEPVNTNYSSSYEYIEDEADAAFANEEKKSKKGSAIRTIILLIALAVFCFSGYQLINIFSEYKHDADIYKGIDTDVVEKDASVTVDLPDGKVVIPFKYDHNALLAINSEGLGYIYVPGINKRLPIAQTTDNTYYIRHAFDHSFSMAGSIFVDYRVPDKLNSPNIVIHGHNRQDGTMFAYLENYLKESYYKKDGYDIFYIYTENKVMKYRIFSVYITEPISDAYTFNFDNLDELREFAGQMKAKSKYDTGVDVSQTTQIVTLSTCTDDTKQRIVVHGTFIGEAPIEQ